MIHIRRTTKALSLTELLVVIGIFAFLLSASGGVVLGLGSLGGFSQKASNLAMVLETARAEAMARNTYVWVGLASEDNGETVYLFAVYSETGMVDDLLHGGNLRPLSRVMEFKGLAAIGTVSASDLINADDHADFWGEEWDTGVSVTNSTPLGPRTFMRVLEFQPSGQVTIAGISPNQRKPVTALAFRGVRRNQSQLAAIEISRSNGRVSVNLL